MKMVLKLSFSDNKVQLQGVDKIKHSYDILGAGMLWKPKDLHKIR
jgi:hypothetical protein